MSAEPPIEALKAVAHPLRFRILEALQSGERNVGEIEQATGITQPSLSQQLAVLRAADLVETRKDAKLVYYKLDGKSLSALAAALGQFAGDNASPAPPARRRAAGAANFARLT
ncbi:MAG: winged helix-turn-helix transcriptional regulator [Erythrobacter sp.]|nr:MAG: winged helix-turn-helix transcriptional regulator [Erythrobacter sp.]